MEELDLDIAGEYIYEAALLIQIKSQHAAAAAGRRGRASRSTDPRQELVQRLLEYRRIKEAAQALAEVDSVRSGIWTRKGTELGSSPPRRTTRRRPSTSARSRSSTCCAPCTACSTATTASTRADLSCTARSSRCATSSSACWKRLEGGRPFDALDDLRSRSCRAEAISAFLAVLEMARLRPGAHPPDRRRARCCSTAPPRSSTLDDAGSDPRMRTPMTEPSRDGSGARGDPVRRRRAGAARAAARAVRGGRARGGGAALAARARALPRRRGARHHGRGGGRRPAPGDARRSSTATSSVLRGHRRATSCRWRRSRRSPSSPTASRSPAPEIQELRGVQSTTVHQDPARAAA